MVAPVPRLARGQMMGAVKNHFHDEICRAAALDAGEAICPGCDEALIEEEGLCRECWNGVNGQFGVGA
jgi:predicted amidophosphoribosyltransferase